MRIKLGFILGMCLMVSACGGVGTTSQQSGTNGSDSAKAINTVDVNQIKASVTTAQGSLSDAQAALSAIFNTSTGAFNWGIFLDGVNFQNLTTSTTTCLQNAFPTSDPVTLVLTAPADIATGLNCILNDVVTVAGIASGDLNTALQVLNVGLAASTPGSADAIAIQEMITQVEQLQTQYNALMQQLGSQLSIVTTFLQELPGLAEGAIPVPLLNILGGVVVSEFVNPIVVDVQQFQTHIEAL